MFLRLTPSISAHLELKDGFTVILVERSDGVETKAIKTSYSSTAGTAYVTFDNVKVPVGNTLGAEGGGIFVILRSAYPLLFPDPGLTRFIAISTMNAG